MADESKLCRSALTPQAIGPSSFSQKLNMGMLPLTPTTRDTPPPPPRLSADLSGCRCRRPVDLCPLF